MRNRIFLSLVPRLLYVRAQRKKSLVHTVCACSVPMVTCILLCYTKITVNSVYLLKGRTAVLHLLLVSSPDPTYERESGDIRLILRASLTLITFWREISENAENTICNTGNLWLLQHWCKKLVISSQLRIQQAINF